jgi:hypothetical protein
MALELPVSRFEAALKEPCVGKWLSSLTEETRPTYLSNLRSFLDWVWQIPEWKGKTPTEFLAFQEETKGRQRFILPDLITDHVQGKGGTYKSMTTQVSHLRTFFTHNRVELPPIGNWHPNPTKEPTKSTLTLEQVRQIILHADPRDQAIYLTMFQGWMDLERFRKFNRKYAALLVKHIHEKGLDEPFRIDFLAGRKRNRRPFYTYIYHDALAAWRFYFEHERGWPREDEPIAITDKGTAPAKKTVRDNFIRTAQRLHIRLPPKVKGERSGIAPHEAFRDVVKSHMHTAKKKGFDMVCGEFWMGHGIDPYNYDKFTEKEIEYMLENVKIAAGYLNILTGPAPANVSEDEMMERILGSPRFTKIVLELVNRAPSKWEESHD